MKFKKKNNDSCGFTSVEIKYSFKSYIVGKITIYMYDFFE